MKIFKILPDDPMFPVDTVGKQSGDGGRFFKGITIRDFLASQIIGGIDTHGYPNSESVAFKAYELADAMLKVRECESTIKPFEKRK